MPPKNSAKPKAGAPKSKAKAQNANAAAIANLRKLQAARRKQMQVDNKQKERDRIRLQRQQEEKQKREEQERKEKEIKEKEKKRKVELRKTKGERDEKRKMEQIRENLLSSGLEIAALKGDVSSKPIMSLAEKKRLRKQQKEAAEQKKREEAERKALLKAQEAEAAKKAAEEAEEDDDDWEKYVSSEGDHEDAADEPAESEDEDTSDVPMDEESILARHHVRMRHTIRETIQRIQEAQKESATAIASVSITSAAKVGSAASSAFIDYSDDENEDGDSDLPLRSPVVCILGHVDVGKTKILDKLRQTNVQVGEAGGITQQIGATFFPVSNIKHALKQAAKNVPESSYDRVPGLLIIDTPGHESFTNLRSRGSSMCNIAILVVDIMHSLEPQTLESLKMILDRQVPFVIALNKIDVLSHWVPCTVRTPDGDIDHSFETALNSQQPMVRGFFEDRLKTVIHDLATQGVNAALYTDKTKDFSDYVRIIPTSAKTGEGLPDLLANLLAIGQTELEDEIRIKPELEATVMEIKTITGLGTTADVILANGTLSEGDTIVVCGSEGAIVSQIRSLLTPYPMKEIRVKTDYLSHKSIMASIGVKVCAAGLENALAGSQLHVAYDPEEEEVLKDKVEDELESTLASFEREETGTYVVASTVGSLEALVTYLKSVKPPIPIANVSVGPVHKRDVMKAAVMLEKNPQMAVILAFDVPIDEDAMDEADKQNVQIFTANIIYHLTKKFEDYLDELKREEGEQRKKSCIYPAKLSCIQCFHDSDPVIVGVRVEVGRLRVGAPIVGYNLDKALIERLKTKNQQAGMSASQALAAAKAAAEKEAKPFEIGFVESIEKDKNSLRVAETGAEVAIKIGRGKNAVPQFGKMFDLDTVVITKFDRPSIDYLKEFEKSMLDQDPQLRRFIADTRGILGIAAPPPK